MDSFEATVDRDEDRLLARFTALDCFLVKRIDSGEYYTGLEKHFVGWMAIDLQKASTSLKQTEH